MMATGERRAGAKGSLAIALTAVSMVVFSAMTVADAAPLTPPLFAPACPREAHVVGGLHSNLAFQSSLPSGSLALRPASCSSQTGFSVGRQLSGGVRTLVSQYRGRGGGGGGGRGRGRGRGDRRPPVQKGPPMNEFISFPEMRVVVANPDGKDTMLGVMSKEEALARAEDLGMDLVVVSPEAQPPVCKIISYDKLRYELEKKEKMKRKNQTVQEIKEVKLSYKIDTHDYEVRVKAATKFLTKGDKVKASIRFKGREMAHRQLAEVTMQKLANDLKAIGTPEKRPMLEGKIMLMTINPTDAVVKAAEQMRKEKLKNKAKKGAAEEEEDSSDDEDEAELAVLAVRYLSSYYYMCTTIN